MISTAPVIPLVLVVFLGATHIEWSAAEDIGYFVGGPFINITQGALQGRNATSRKGRTFYEFLGIPYGKIPARFEISEASDGWDGVRDATSFAQNCIQVDPFTGVVSGEEDCLFLNVFTPGVQFIGNVTQKLPVFFVVHTEGFATSDPQSLRPEVIIDENVILVTPNFRLGPMGFLNAEVESARGNQGLKDLVLALKWVQNNIERFGGDPENVIIDGTPSQGGNAVSFLTLSSMAKGLFSGAISEGGTALCPFTKQFKSGLALRNSKKLANSLDCPSSSPTYLVKCLQKVEAETLLQQTVPVDIYLFDVSRPFFGPSLETVEGNSSQVFLSEQPNEILLNGTFNKVPYIIGANSHEELLLGYTMLTNTSVTETLNEEWGRVAPNSFVFDEYTRDPCVISSKIRDEYFGNQNFSIDVVEQLGNLIADRFVFQCVRETALLYSKHAPVYLYNFTQPTLNHLEVLNWYRQKEIQRPPSDAEHSRHLFETPFTLSKSSRNSADYEIVERLAKLWASFAKNKKPTLCDSSCESSNSINNNEWSALDANSQPLSWFSIEDKPEMKGETPEFTSRMDFWNALNLNDNIKRKSASIKDDESAVTTTPIMIISSDSSDSSTSTTPSPQDNKPSNNEQQLSNNDTGIVATTTTTATPSTSDNMNNLIFLRSDMTDIDVPQLLTAAEVPSSSQSSSDATLIQNNNSFVLKNIQVSTAFKINATLLLTLLHPQSNQPIIVVQQEVV